MAAKKTDTPVAKKPTPKFGEVGYKFTIEGTIVEVYPEGDDNNYPFSVNYKIGKYEDCEYSSVEGCMTYYYERRPLLEAIQHTNPKVVLEEKKAELKKAQEIVDRLIKEIDALK